MFCSSDPSLLPLMSMTCFQVYSDADALEKLLLTKNEELGPLPESEFLSRTPKSTKKAHVRFIPFIVCSYLLFGHLVLSSRNMNFIGAVMLTCPRHSIKLSQMWRGLEAARYEVSRHPCMMAILEPTRAYAQSRALVWSSLVIRHSVCNLMLGSCMAMLANIYAIKLWNIK